VRNANSVKIVLSPISVNPVSPVSFAIHQHPSILSIRPNLPLDQSKMSVLYVAAIYQIVFSLIVDMPVLVMNAV